MSVPATRRVVAFDGLLRLIHAWNALSILALIASGLIADEYEHSATGAALWRLHIQMGYALIGGLIARLVWGLIGPDTARWSDLWHPREWLATLRALPRLSLPASRRGHDTLASALFICLYFVLTGLAVTGLALTAIQHNTGPLTIWLGDSVWLKHLFKEPHEALYGLVVGFIGLHLAALIWHQFIGKAPVAQAMLTGNQYLTKGGDHA
ncbi:MAG: cytochrome b/b6 domain-containing protein [Sterolibacterium sp.]|nr:cytochrome b/b6 domain-containing protein [Sterolibacterium sp.]